MSTVDFSDISDDELLKPTLRVIEQFAWKP